MLEPPRAPQLHVELIASTSCNQKYSKLCGGWCLGCTLPVEMFFPGKELPTAAFEAALSEVGVVCRPLPDLQPHDFPPSNATDTETDLSGFTMKVAALVLSRFQQASLLP